MWRKGHTSALLAGTQTRAATVKNSMVVPQIIKNKHSRWWQSTWKQKSPPPMSRLEYNEIQEQSSWITNWRIAEESYNQGFTEDATSWLVKWAEVEQMLMPFHGWWLKSWRNIPPVGGLCWDTWGLNPKTVSPPQSIRAGKRHTHNIWLWKTVGFLSTKVKLNRLENRHTIKGPMHKILFPATHSGIWRIKGKLD